MKRRFLSESAWATKRFAESLARKILKTKARRKDAIVLALSGDLGSGKTVFVKGFAKGLDIKKNILSPTFVLIKRYPIKNRFFKNFYHIDCYRMKSAGETMKLGWKELVKNPENIIAVEWMERIHKILPKKHLRIRFKHKNRNQRIIYA